MHPLHIARGHCQSLLTSGRAAGYASVRRDCLWHTSSIDDHAHLLSHAKLRDMQAFVAPSHRPKAACSKISDFLACPTLLTMLLMQRVHSSKSACATFAIDVASDARRAVFQVCLPGKWPGLPA